MALIIFDLHGVLVSTKRLRVAYTRGYTRILEQAGVPKNKAERIHSQALDSYFGKWAELLKEYDSRASTNQDHILDCTNMHRAADDAWLRTIRSMVSPDIFESIKPKLRDKALEAKILENYDCSYSEIAEVCEDLIMQGHKLVVASNAERFHVEAVLKGAKLLKFFAEIVGCDDLGAHKNDQSYFQKLRRYLEPRFKHFGEQTYVYVGNSSQEVRGAVAANMIPVAIYRERDIDKDALSLARSVMLDLLPLPALTCALFT